MRERRVHGLVAATAAGDDDAEAAGDLALRGIHDHVPGATSAEEHTQVVRLTCTAERPVGLLLVHHVAARDLQLHDRGPELLVGALGGVERANRHLAVLARVLLHVACLGDEADALLEHDAACHELLAGGADGAVGPVPGEGAVAHAGVAAEGLVEERLPARAVPGTGRLVEQEQRAPGVLRVRRRADEEEAVPPLHHPVERQRVDVRRPDERAGHEGAHAAAGLPGSPAASARSS